MKKITFITTSKETTINFGKIVSGYMKKGGVILLTGDLGAGKTTFTKGLAAGLGIKDKVNSPTFNILKCYFSGRINLYHIDAYRLEDNQSDIGLEEFIEGDGICVIEWPNYIVSLIPDGCLNIVINSKQDDVRQIEVYSSNDIYDELFRVLENEYV